jgi:hypothetical protein
VSRLRARLTHRDEQGVAIVLALAFIVLVGVVTTALLSSLTSSVNQRTTLDKVRDRQYAADAAVERDIARVRGLGAPGAGLVACGGPQTYSGVNAVTIRVECTNVPTLTRTGYIQRNVVFTSCVDTGAACTSAKTIVRAQVNYEAADAETPAITKTYIQSWTVAR